MHPNTAAPNPTLSVVHKLKDGDPISGTFLGPVHVREVMLSGTDQSPVAIIESERLPLNMFAKLVVPFLVVASILMNLFVLKSAIYLVKNQTSFFSYLIYLCLMELLEFTARGVDSLVECYNGVRLFTAIQFLDGTACQLLTMAYSAFTHIHSTLLIGLAVDSLRLARNPVKFIHKYRSEWTLNLFILASALSIAVDSQFFWTFELNCLDRKMLHERMVNNAYRCGFSNTANLSVPFLYYIWPIIDHLWGEVLPCLTSLFSGFIILNWRTKLSQLKTERWMNNCISLFTVEDDKENASESSSCSSTAVRPLELLRTMGFVCIVNGTFVAPRFIYYIAKCSLFSSKYAGCLKIRFNHSIFKGWASSSF